MRNIVDREVGSTCYDFTQNTGETETYTVNMTRLMALRGTSLASAVFTKESGDATIASQSTSADTATVGITMAGKSKIKLTATQADGNVRVLCLSLRSEVCR